jgi:hypothetical protein
VKIEVPPKRCLEIDIPESPYEEHRNMDLIMHIEELYLGSEASEGEIIGIGNDMSPVEAKQMISPLDFPSTGVQTGALHAMTLDDSKSDDTN